MAKGGKEKANSERTNPTDQTDDHGFDVDPDDEENSHMAHQFGFSLNDEDNFDSKEVDGKPADLDPSVLGLQAIETSGFSEQIDNGNKFFNYISRFHPRGDTQPAAIFYRLQVVSVRNLTPGLLMAVLAGTNWKDANLI